MQNNPESVCVPWGVDFTVHVMRLGFILLITPSTLPLTHSLLTGLYAGPRVIEPTEWPLEEINFYVSA